MARLFPKVSSTLFGGEAPFLDNSSAVAPNVTVVGTLDTNQTTPIEGDLMMWLGDHHSGIVYQYAGFGTGTVLEIGVIVDVT